MRDRHRKAMVAKTYRRVLASSFRGGGLKLDASFIEVSPEPPDYSEWIPSRKREFQPISLKAEGGRRKHPTAFRLLHTSPCLLAYYGHKHSGGLPVRILITGGAGFIGSYLAEAYLKRGDEVYVIDDLSTGTLDNITPLQEHHKHRERLFVSIDTVLNRDRMLEHVCTCDMGGNMAADVG